MEGVLEEIVGKLFSAYGIGAMPWVLVAYLLWRDARREEKLSILTETTAKALTELSLLIRLMDKRPGG